jgi:hypothetical protein
VKLSTASREWSAKVNAFNRLLDRLIGQFWLLAVLEFGSVIGSFSYALA